MIALQHSFLASAVLSFFVSFVSFGQGVAVSSSHGSVEVGDFVASGFHVSDSPSASFIAHALAESTASSVRKDKKTAQTNSSASAPITTETVSPVPFSAVSSRNQSSQKVSSITSRPLAPTRLSLTLGSSRGSSTHRRPTAIPQTNSSHNASATSVLSAGNNSTNSSSELLQELEGLTAEMSDIPYLNITLRNGTTNTSACYENWQMYSTVMGQLELFWLADAITSTTSHLTSTSSVITSYASRFQGVTSGVFTSAGQNWTTTLTRTDYSSWAANFSTSWSTFDSYTTKTQKTANVSTLGVPRPTCALPSIWPACQAQWDGVDPMNYNWSIHSAYPVCQEAQVKPEVCSKMNYEYTGTDVGLSLGPGCTADCKQCAVTGKSVELIYWPVKTAPGQRNVTITPTETGLVTATGFGTTFTSPTVYVSFDKLWANNRCGPLGTTHTGTIIPVSSSDISTMTNQWGIYEVGGEPNPPPPSVQASQLNFADLNQPYDWNSYLNQMGCACRYFGTDCACIHTLADFKPQLVLPPEVRALDPAWADCEMQWDGVYDPPYALHPAQEAAAPSPTNPWSNIHTTTPAAPCITPVPPTPTSTAEPASGDPGTSGDPDPGQSGDPSDPAPVNPGGIVSSILGGASPAPGQPTPPTSSNNAGSIIASMANGGLPPDPYPATGSDPSGSANDPSSNGGSGAGSTADPGSVGGTGVGTGPGSEAGTGAGSRSGGQSSSGGGSGSGSEPGGSPAPAPAPAPDPTPAGGDPSNGQQPNPAPAGSVGGTLTGSNPSQGQQPDPTPAGSPEGASAASDPSNSQQSDPASAGSAGGTPENGDPSNGQQAGPGPAYPAGGAPGGGDPVAPGPAPVTSAAVVTIGSETHTVASGGALILGSTTVVPGGPAATLSGQVVSVASDGVAVGGNTASYLQPLAGASQAQPAAAVTIGSQVHTVAAGGSLDLGSTTLVAGGKAATVSGQIVSVAPQGVAVGSNTIAYSAPRSPDTGSGSSSAAVFTFGTQTYTAPAGSGGSLIIGSTTLRPGGAITTSGTVISMGPSGVVVGSTTLPYVVLPSNGAIPTPEPVLTVGSTPYTATNGGSFIIDGQTLTPGGAITAGGSTIGLSPSGLPAVVNINGESQTLSSAFVAGGSPSSGAVFTIGSQVVTASDPAGTSGIAVIGSQTLTEGSQAASIDGQTVSLGQDGLVVGGTQTVPLSAVASGASGSEAIFTIGSQAVTVFDPAGSSGVAVIGSQTLTLGGADATISGQEVSLGSGGIILGGSSTVPINAIPNIPTDAVASATFTGTDGAVETAFSFSGSDGVAVIDGTTLSIGGPAATIDGQVVSEASGGLVVDSTSTIPFSTVIATDGSPTPTGSAGSGSSDPGIAGLSGANVIDAKHTLALVFCGMSFLVMLVIA